MIRAHHKEHCLDDLLAHSVTHDIFHVRCTSSLQYCKDDAKLFDSSDAEHASLADLMARLIDILRCRITTSEDNNTIITEIGKVGHQAVESFLFTVLKETVLLFDKLIDHLS